MVLVEVEGKVRGVILEMAAEKEDRLISGKECA